MVASGNISKSQPQCSNISYHSKDISELFPTASMSSYFILIEGAPGIGKTVLSKEIAYQWATNKLLTFKKLVFLLFLRDPNLKNMVILENLTQYLCNNTKRGAELSEYLLQTKGKDLTIIFDGYDEMSEEDRNNSLVTKIISRNVLQECDLVITSRPTASLHLRDMANCRVEVLGFTEEDRLDYIQHALEGSDEKLKILQAYLQSNSTINALCYVPLNMTILLCLYEDINTSPNNTLNIDNIKEIGLPNTQTEMYEKFILMTITRCIKRNNKKFSGKYLKISELPEPDNEIFNELLQLAYYALTKDKIVFNSDEEFIQQFCKNLKSGNCEGLGLLKVTEHVNNVSFHFLHFSIQEYLAAYYIASLSSSRQFQLLKDTFWDIHYFNTWIMYVGITGGEKLAWKHYISGNWFLLFTKIFKSSKISKSFLNDKIKSLHLFQCFAEIGNKELVRKIFKDKIIDLSNQTLLPRDINTLCFFLMRSVNKHWIKLDLSNCNIGDIGSDILSKTFFDKNRDIVCIDKVDLSHNLLQNQAILRLIDVVKFWHTSEAIINEDCDNYDNLFKICLNKVSLYVDEAFSQTIRIGPFVFAYNPDQQFLCNQLINSTNLTGLYVNICNYQSVDSTFQERNHKLNLSKLHVVGKNLPVDFLGTIIQRMKEVNNLYIYDNTLSDEDVNYLSSLILYKTNPSDTAIWVVIGSTKVLGILRNLLNLNINFSPIEIFNLAKSIRRLCSGSSMSTTNYSQCNHYDSKSIFEDLLNSLYKNASKCDITFCMTENNILIANGVKFNDLSKLLILNDCITSVYIKMCELNITEFVNLISKQNSLQRLYIFSLLEIRCFRELCGNLLNTIPWLKELLVHSTDSSCILTSDMLTAQRIYTSVLLITSDMLIGQNPTSRQLSCILQLEPNIKVWKLPNCHISVQTFYQLIVMLNDVHVTELDISGCNLGECELQEFKQYTKQVKCFADFMKLNINDIKITNQAAINMANILSNATNLNNFVLSNSTLLTTCSASKLLNNFSVMVKFDISFNAINDETANDIAVFLSHNSELKELNLSSCNLQTIGAVRVFKGMRNLSHLTKLNVSNNNISGEAADDIAVVLSQNNSLEELDLSHNCIQATGAVKIFKKMNSILHLSKFNISHNSITVVSAYDLAKFLSQNVGLKELDLSYNYLQTKGTTIVCKGISGLTNLTKLNISNNDISGEAACDIAVVLSQNKSLEELNISYNNLGASGVVRIFMNMKNFADLVKLNIGSIGMTNFAADDLAVVLNNNKKLKELNLSYNNIQADGTAEIFNKITMLNLNKLDISHNNITSQAAEDIATFLSQNTELKELDLSYNSLQTTGAVKICRANISKLIKFNICHNNITTEATDDIAVFLSHNHKLQVLNLSGNDLQCTNIFKNMQTFNDLSVLKLSDCSIISEAAKASATVLLNNTKVKEIDLSYNDLSASDAIAIFEGMKSISDLVAIDISHNMITDEATDSIADVLLCNTKLKELDVSHNNFSASGAVKIFKGMKTISSLEIINISHNMITDEAADHIATILSRNNNLQVLNISSNYLRSVGCAKILGGIKNIVSLTDLDIGCNKVTIKVIDNDASCLFLSSQSKELGLSNKFVHTAGAIEVFKSTENISSLKQINLADTMTTDIILDDLAAFLSQNTELKELDISSNNLQTAGVIKIFQNIKCLTSFTKLNIAHNMIDDEAAEYIATVLCNCSELVELNLCHNNLRNMSAFDCLLVPNLTKIDFSNNNIDEQTANDLATFLSQCTKLEELDLGNNNLQTTGGIELFKNLSCFNLKKVNISSNCLTQNAAYHIAKSLSKNNKLQEIDLSCNTLQNAGIIKILASIKILNLTKLNISNNDIDGIETLLRRDVIRATKLITLNLSCNKINYPSFNEFLFAISNLIQLNMHNIGITDETAEALAFVLSRNVNLQELDISDNMLHPLGISHIFEKSTISLLAKFNISNNVIGDEAADVVGSFLSKNIKLKELDVSFTNLYESGTTKLCKKIANLSKLTKLNIGGNNFTHLAANDVAKVLLNNTTLQTIDLSDNDAVGAASIFNAMKDKFTLLRSINISHNWITTEAAEDIATVLSQNIHLKELYLADNFLGATICKGLMNISYLTHFDISCNKISDEAAHDIAIFLLHNPELEVVDLSDNLIQATGATKIFGGIRAHSNLNKVSICKNAVTDEAADAMAKFLSQSSKLKEFDVSYNYLQTVGAVKIFRAIKTSNLSKLNINNNSITGGALPAIIDILSTDSKLKEVNVKDNNSLINSCRFYNIKEQFTKLIY